MLNTVIILLLKCHLALSVTNTVYLGSGNVPIQPKRVSLHYLPAQTNSNLQDTGPILFNPALNGASQIPAASYEGSLAQIADGNPLLAALLLGQRLDIKPEVPGFNHPQHLPINPYLALLLSHYGRYVPIYGLGKGIYGYTAANNYHNNLPTGNYKLYIDRDI